jgi:hypothetical protein
MYYDKLATVSGEGFYPECENRFTNNIRIDIMFSNINDEWIQIDNRPIYGLDKYTGMYLLKTLNLELNKQSMCIRNIGGRIIYPFIYEVSTYKMIKHYLD